MTHNNIAHLQPVRLWQKICWKLLYTCVFWHGLQESERTSALICELNLLTSDYY